MQFDALRAIRIRRGVRERPLPRNSPRINKRARVIKVSLMSASMRMTILWVHAVGGVAWVGAATVFVIAASAVGLEDEEGLAMVRRIAPAINRIGLAAMLFIIVSGVVNIYLAGLTRGFAFSNNFIELLFAKIAILLAMFGVLTASWRAEARLASTDPSQARSAAYRLMRYNLAVIGLGAAALLIGLWLLGS